MPATVPKLLKNFNIFIDGRGFAGLASKVTPPELKIKNEEWRGGGMDAPIAMDMGMEKIELKGAMAEHNPALFLQFGLMNGNGVSMTLRGAASDDKKVVPIVINATGKYQSLTSGEWKAGDKPELDFMLDLRYYKLSIDGQACIEIDILAGKRIIGGTDQMQQMRNALNL